MLLYYINDNKYFIYISTIGLVALSGGFTWMRIKICI